jgi:hypothetical protein
MSDFASDQQGVSRVHMFVYSELSVLDEYGEPIEHFHSKNPFTATEMMADQTRIDGEMAKVEKSSDMPVKVMMLALLTF